MYVPPAFAVADDEAWAMLGRARLGVLVTAEPDGLAASHLPFLIDRERGVLSGHLARANPHALGTGEEALVVFAGPDAYVSPGWYATKAEHGRVVPTWNYEAVHVRGRLTRFDDPARLHDVVDRLSDHHEADRPAPWSVADAPADYIDRLLRGIVGLELAVTSVVVKRKLSQNQPEANRTGVLAGLDAGSPADRALAGRMRAEGRDQVEPLSSPT